jgi:hypothetical protein
MKKLLPVLFLFSLLFASCDLFDTDLDLDGNFWAQNIRTNRLYRLDAEMLAQGDYCEIWVEKKSGVPVEIAEAMAAECDKIYLKMISTFSPVNINYGSHTYGDLLKLADAFGDGNGKLCVLLLDIQDNYMPDNDGNVSYIAGYFTSYDLLTMYGSNKRDMIYIDTNPGIFFEGVWSINGACKTLAHETQHLMNFAASRVWRGGHSMETWIDEGLSSAAEWMQSNEHPFGRWGWYNNNGQGAARGLINKGNNFYVWGNRTGENGNAGLDDYATTYLFFQWLRLQADTENIYKDIISSGSRDYNAVTGAFNQYGHNFTDWDSLLKTWLAANNINATSGIYGYKNDPVLKAIKAPFIPAGTTAQGLYPGEGVYSRVVNTEPNLTGQGTHVRNAYLTTTVNSAYQPNSVLLTYNSNVNNENHEGLRETGKTTGAGASVMPASAAMLINTRTSEPIPVDLVVHANE